MPQKSIQQRTRLARKAGVPPTLKDSDVHLGPTLSRHAAKKSGHVAGALWLENRNVSFKAPPGEGRRRRRAIEDLREAYRAENAASGGGRPRRPRPEKHPRPLSKVNGRKKPPSRMNIKRRGGPRTRSRLHGG